MPPCLTHSIMSYGSRVKWGSPVFLSTRVANFTLFVNWITITRKSGEHLRTTYGNTGQLIRSHQQCIPWTSPLEIKPATTDCRAETLRLAHRSIWHTSDAKLTSHCMLHSYSLQWTRSTPGPCLPERIRNTHPCNYHGLKSKETEVDF